MFNVIYTCRRVCSGPQGLEIRMAAYGCSMKLIVSPSSIASVGGRDPFFLGGQSEEQPSCRKEIFLICVFFH